MSKSVANIWPTAQGKGWPSTLSLTAELLVAVGKDLKLGERPNATISLSQGGDSSRNSLASSGQMTPVAEDMALLIGSGELDHRCILEALRLTFERRATHDLASLVPPPADWQIPFQALARECGLPTNIAAVSARVQELVEAVLALRSET